MSCHTTCPSLAHLAAGLLCAVVASGCASQQTLRVVDAQSGEPLDEVRVERLEGSYKPSAIPFVVVNELSPSEKQATNKSGTVTFKTSGDKFMVNPSRDNPGYDAAYVKATWSGATVRDPSTYREFSATRKDGVLQIPLQRRGLYGDAGHAVKASASGSEKDHAKTTTDDVAQHDDKAKTTDAPPGT